VPKASVREQVVARSNELHHKLSKRVSSEGCCSFSPWSPAGVFAVQLQMGGLKNRALIYMSVFSLLVDKGLMSRIVDRWTKLERSFFRFDSSEW
jgi:predicted membrane-bound mannosyltransferase